MNPLPPYRYGSARTMVYLNGEYLKVLLAVWREARAASITLPETEDPNYVSLETLLTHVLRAAGNYMVWMCDKLGLPDPEIEPAPALDLIESEAERYIDHLIDRWRQPLSSVEEERFYRPEYTSKWGVKYCVDSMLEHAVMHAILHRQQLQELLVEQGAA